MILHVLAALLAADPSLTKLQAEDARMATIGWRLQTANVALCPQSGLVSGLALHALSQYQKSQRPAATAQFGLRNRVGIAAVAPGSAGDRAGLKAGDAILAIDGIKTRYVNADSGYAPVGHVEAMLDAALARAPVEVAIERASGVEDAVSLTADRGCPSRIQIVVGKAVNAAADGRYVQVNAAMVDFAVSDDELAVIVGHELAHNILRHIATNTPAKQAEFEADRLGVWLMARAGYDVDAVIPFWTRFEKRTNPGIFADGTHPSPKKRIAAVAAAVAEFKSQRAASRPLLPIAQ